jgi:glycosyltransferase involved in cell wall biosynthesis
MINERHNRSSVSLVDFSVIIMAYNEVQSLEATVKELDHVLQNLGKSYELVIVDDGSQDGTSALAKRLARKIPPIRVIHHGSNLGLGGVYRTGFVQAHGRFVTFFPADGQFPGTIIHQFAPLIESQDIVLGYLASRHEAVPAKLLSWLERTLYRWLFGSFPRFQGIFMVRREILEQFPLKSAGRGWAIVMELILRATRAGFRTVSVPTDSRPRAFDHSKVNNLPSILSNLKQLLILRRML